METVPRNCRFLSLVVVEPVLTYRPRNPEKIKDTKKFGHGEVRVYRGTGVSRGVRRTTWERSLEIWELPIPCFEEFFWGGNTLGLVPASLPHALGNACTFYTPTSPPPKSDSKETFGVPVKVTFESLFYVFELFEVSGSVGLLPGHNTMYPNPGLMSH